MSKMTNALDTVKGVFSKAAPEPEVTAVYDRLTDAKKVAADLETEFSRKLAEVEQAEKKVRLLARTAVDLNDKAYAAAKMNERRLGDELDFIRNKQAAASDAVAQAEAELRRVGHADIIRNQARLGRLAEKYAAEIETKTHELHDALRRLNDVRGRSRLSWPNGSLPHGALLHERELNDALAHYFYRISGKPFSGVPSSNSAPELPGARPLSLIDPDPRKIPTLSEAIKQANEYLLKKLETIPFVPKSAAQVQQQPQPSPQTAPERQSSETKIDARGYVPERHDLSEYLPGGKP